MELNEKQNHLIATFAQKFCNHSETGNIHASAHLTDVRQLVEACVAAADEKKEEIKA